MATFRSFEEIDAWKMGRELTRRVYQVTTIGRLARDFALRDQMRRAAISVMSNIAEGFERSGKAEFVQFLAIAKGSAGEIRSHLFVAHDLGYVSDGVAEELMELAARVGRTTSGLIEYLCRSDLKGTKFRRRRSSEARQPGT